MPLAMMKRTRELVLLLISIAFLAAYALPEEHQGAQAPPRKWTRPSPGVLPSPLLLDPELRECWTHLRRPPGCMSSIYESSDKGKVWLSQECCGAVKALSNRCFRKIFTDKPFPQEFPQKIDAFCASGHGASSASAPAF